MQGAIRRYFSVPPRLLSHGTRPPPDLAAAPHTPTRRLGAHEQLAESVGTAPLQLGSRQPCRPPPHTRASMAAACVPGLSRPPSRGGSGPLQATGVAGAQVRGRPKLPTPSACTDGSPYRFRVCAVSRACKVGTEHHFGRFGRFARTCTGTAHSRSGGGAAADGATSIAWGEATHLTRFRRGGTATKDADACAGRAFKRASARRTSANRRHRRAPLARRRPSPLQRGPPPARGTRGAPRAHQERLLSRAKSTEKMQIAPCIFPVHTKLMRGCLAES